jgi:branched-chain amino acid transport system permease protein
MKSRDYILFAILLALAAAFPFMGIPRYIIASALLLFCYATVVSQWNLVFGVAGIFSLAQLAIFAFGAYTTALMGRYLDWSLWPTFPVAGAAGVVFSFFIGLACLRMRGIYVALLTLAISQTMFVLIQTDSNCSALNKAMNPSTCVSFTGGAQGLGDFGTFGWRAVLGVRNWMIGDYYSMLGLLIVALVLRWR